MKATKKATKAPAKAGSLPKLPAGQAWFAALGSKGTAAFPAKVMADGVVPVRDHNGDSAELPKLTLALGKASVIPWKGKEGTTGKAVAAWVSRAGQPVVIVRLEDGSAPKGYRWHTATVHTAEEGKATVALLVPSGWSDAEALPQYCAAPALRGGRLEGKAVRNADGSLRNAPFRGKLAPAAAK